MKGSRYPISVGFALAGGRRLRKTSLLSSYNNLKNEDHFTHTRVGIEFSINVIHRNLIERTAGRDRLGSREGLKGDEGAREERERKQLATYEVVVELSAKDQEKMRNRKNGLSLLFLPLQHVQDGDRRYVNHKHVHRTLVRKREGD